MRHHLQMCWKGWLKSKHCFWLESGVDRLWMRGSVWNGHGMCCFPNR
ncbi:hypothetical protein Gotur_033569 [Gossypium turneri]